MLLSLDDTVRQLRVVGLLHDLSDVQARTVCRQRLCEAQAATRVKLWGVDEAGRFCATQMGALLLAVEIVEAEVEALWAGPRRTDVVDVATLTT